MGHTVLVGVVLMQEQRVLMIELALFDNAESRAACAWAVDVARTASLAGAVMDAVTVTVTVEGRYFEYSSSVLGHRTKVATALHRSH